MWQQENDHSKFFITWIERPSNKHINLSVDLGSYKGIELYCACSNGNDTIWAITIDRAKPAKMTAFRLNNLGKIEKSLVLDGKADKHNLAKR